MRAALAILASLLSATLHAQNFALMRSEIKTTPSTSAGGQFQISGAVNSISLHSSGNTFVLDGGFSTLGFTPPTPQLAHLFFQRNSTAVQLAWRTVATGFYIETAADLRRPAWSIVNPTRIVQTNLTSVSIPLGPNQSYVRLRHASSLP
jgi:hypothetical protein